MDLLRGATEIRGRRTRNAKHYRKPDGKYVAVIGQKLHYEKSPGQWEDIDLTLHKVGQDWVADKNDVIVRVSGTWPGIEVSDRVTGKGFRWVTPKGLSCSGQTASYSDGGLTWTYTTTPNGFKLAADVTAPRGPQTYSFIIQPRGGLPFPVVAEDGSLVTEVVRITRPVIIGADHRRYETSGWQRGPGNKIQFSFDDSEIPPEAYPYVIDPSTTFETAVGTDDYHIDSEDGVYPPTVDPKLQDGGDVWVSRADWWGWWWVANGFIRWNIGSLPHDIEITNVTFRAATWEIRNDTNSDRLLIAEWYPTDPWPRGPADYAPEAPATWDGSWTLPANTWEYTGGGGDESDFVEFSINPANMVPDTQGYVGIRMHIAGGAPGEGKTVGLRFRSKDQGLPSPKLIIEYQEAGPPEQTISPTGISSQEMVPSPTVLPGPVTITSLGIATQEAFGTPTLTQPQLVYPTSILSGEAFGVPDLTTILEVRPVGIPSGEVVPAPVLYPGEVFILPVSIPSGEAFGIPELVEPSVVRVVGIPSAEAFGSPTITTQLVVQVEGIVSREEFGRALVRLLRYALPPEASLVLNVPYQGGLQIESPYRASLQLENRVTGDLILVRKR